MTRGSRGARRLLRIDGMDPPEPREGPGRRAAATNACVTLRAPESKASLSLGEGIGVCERGDAQSLESAFWDELEMTRNTHLTRACNVCMETIDRGLHHGAKAGDRAP
jgi:hypothetical protein